MTTAPVTDPCDVLVRDATEAECRRVMATRAGIKLRYDTRVVREDLLAEADVLLDRYLELSHGIGPAPHA